MNDARQLLISLVQLPEVLPAAPHAPGATACNAVLARILSGSSVYANVGAATLNGDYV